MVDNTPEFSTLSEMFAFASETNCALRIGFFQFHYRHNFEVGRQRPFGPKDRISFILVKGRMFLCVFVLLYYLNWQR